MVQGEFDKMEYYNQLRLMQQSCADCFAGTVTVFSEIFFFIYNV